MPSMGPYLPYYSNFAHEKYGTYTTFTESPIGQLWCLIGALLGRLEGGRLSTQAPIGELHEDKSFVAFCCIRNRTHNSAINLHARIL